MRVLLNRFMEASECIVDHRAFANTRNDAVKAQMHTVVNSEAAVLSVLILVIDIIRVLGTSKTFLLTVLVDSPEDINAVVNGLLVAVSTEQRGGKGEKGHILSLQFENC
mgnify:CR=1 FL=1